MIVERASFEDPSSIMGGPSPRPASHSPIVLKDSSLNSIGNAESKAKHKSDKHRLFLAELLHLYPDLQTRTSAPSDDQESNSSHSKGTNPSPTDSHAHRRSDSHPPSHPSRRSYDSISSILRMTTEKLYSETARANSAERQIADFMSLFKNTHEQKTKLERELLRVREELGLYKVQLEVAQKEIFRAQDIVERIDRQRVEAEESAVRAREKGRKLAEARAVDLAMEEGRRLGFEEGLNQGRMMAQVQSHPRSSSSETARSHRSRSTARSKRRPTPQELPKTTRPRSVSSRPEEITIQSYAEPPRSTSVDKRSPVVSRRSVVLPPDNYIPFLNADATISLPPPHELNMPLSTEPPRPLSSSLVLPQTFTEKSTKEKSLSYKRSATPPSPTPKRDPPDREKMIPMVTSEEPRSPATYPNRPPLRRREVVMPVPLAQQFPGSNHTTSSDMLDQSAITSKHTAPSHAIRTPSNASIPAIQVETPSTKSPSSERTVYNPTLLTPDQSNKPVPLPSQTQDEAVSTGAFPLDPTGRDTIMGVLSDNNLPPGFVPLSPITVMATLNPYPPIIPPGLQAAEQSPMMRPDFVYPASPLARSQ